jgi:hypothetical protein
LLIFDSLIEPKEAIAEAVSIAAPRPLPIALVAKGLGAHCAAEKDLVGLPPYLTGMERLWS